jgi:hypothetical protein
MREVPVPGRPVPPHRRDERGGEWVREGRLSYPHGCNGEAGRASSCFLYLLSCILVVVIATSRAQGQPPLLPSAVCLLARCGGEALLAARDGGRASCCPGISPTATPCAQQQALKALCALRFAALSGLYPLSSVIPSPQYIVALYCIASYCARAPREPALGACGSPLSSMALSNSISNQAASSPRLCLCIAMHRSTRISSPPEPLHSSTALRIGAPVPAYPHVSEPQPLHSSSRTSYSIARSIICERVNEGMILHP